MVTGYPVDLNLTMSPSSCKIPALLMENSAPPCQMESCGEIMWIRVRPIDDDDEVKKVKVFTSPFLVNRAAHISISLDCGLHNCGTTMNATV